MAYGRTHALLDITPVDSEVEGSDLTTDSDTGTDSDIEAESENAPYVPQEQGNVYSTASGSYTEIPATIKSPTKPKTPTKNTVSPIRKKIPWKSALSSPKTPKRGPGLEVHFEPPRSYVEFTPDESVDETGETDGVIQTIGEESSEDDYSITSSFLSPGPRGTPEVPKDWYTSGTLLDIPAGFTPWKTTESPSTIKNGNAKPQVKMSSPKKRPDGKIKRSERTRKNAIGIMNKLRKTVGGRVLRQKAVPVVERQREIGEVLMANLGILMPSPKLMRSPRGSPNSPSPPPPPHPKQTISIPISPPLPIRKSYPPHPPTDRPDTFFKTQFHTLYTSIHNLIDTFFGYPDLPDQPWSVIEMPPEFITWADLVAEEDPMVGGWEEMLGNGSSRKFLIIGILVRILKERVFDEGVYGGSGGERELVRGIERGLVDREGFQRTTLRSTTLRTLLSSSPTTPNFYPTITYQSTQVFSLLLPLLNHLYTLPSTPTWQLPASKHFYQGLHDIFSDAGYLSLCMRISPSIFYITFSSPGTDFIADEAKNVDPKNWERSKKAVLTRHIQDIEAWRHAHHTSLNSIRSLLSKSTNASNPSIHSHEGFKKIEEWATIKAIRPLLATEAFKAKVKISVWPTIKRFKGGSWKQDDKDIPDWEKKGMREIPITTSLVLCYYARVKSVGKGTGKGGVPSTKQNITLRQYLQNPELSLSHSPDHHSRSRSRSRSLPLELNNQDQDLLETIRKNLFSWYGLTGSALFAYYLSLLVRQHSERWNTEDLFQSIADLGDWVREVGRKGQERLNLNVNLNLGAREEGLLEMMRGALKG